MPIRKSKQINLIPQDEFESSNFGRILKWALSTFRVMVIITELLVMSAFLSRFWLDAKNSDLNDKLEINKTQVEAYSDVESEFRLHQQQLKIAKSLYAETAKNKIISSIIQYLPPEISLNSISINDDVILIKAYSSNEASVNQFLVNLEANKEIRDVNLSQLSSGVDANQNITFTITAKTK